MLIASPRHSARDLAHWLRLERYDAILARSADLARREARALDALRAFASQGPCYVGTSWGKDSVVVAHLAWRLAQEGVRLPVVWLRLAAGANPDCLLVRDAFLSRFPIDYHEIHAPEEVRRASDGLREVAHRFGDRHVSGVRADESSTRTLTMRRNGEASARTCRPIGWWRGEHVFAYLARHDLPVHPAYACTWGGTLDRIRVRVDAIGGERGTGRGRAEWERHYYRDVVEAIEALEEDRCATAK